MSGLYTRLYSGLLFPLQERLKGHTSRAVLRSLERTQWLSAGDLRSLQIERLRDLVAHAETHVPHYRRVFHEHGFSVRDIETLEDLQRLPLLTKADIRADPEAFKSGQATNLVRSNTGGSSGEPLVFWLGRERVSHDVAAKWRATRWWDVDIGDPEAVLWGSPIELGAQDRMRALRDRLQRSLLLPAFDMSPEKVRGFIRAIRRHRPRMLFGYPSAINHVALAAESEGVRLNDLEIRVAFVTGESLYDDQRARIARVFGCRVANGYGGRDAGFVAHECPHGSLHLTAEDVIVEIVDPDGRPVTPGEPGEIVVTHLASRDFPFIRYRTGDVATAALEPCTCSRGLPGLREIQGRSTDFVVAQDGTVMHGLALIYILRDTPEIDSFQIIQETRDLTRVLFMAGEELNEKRVKAICGQFKSRLGSSVEISLERVASLPAEPSGKFRHVKSRIDIHSLGG